MARLGKAFAQPRILSLVPGGYQHIVEIHPGDLPSGTGTGKDYVIVVQALLGPHTFTQAGQEVTRIGLHSTTRGELSRTWTQIPHAESPLPNTRRLGMPIQIVRMVQDWAGNEVVALAGYITTGTGIVCSVQAVNVLLIDLTAMGGARVSGGWDGTNVVYREQSFPSGTSLGLSPVGGVGVTAIANAPLPWTSGTDTWLALWSQELHPKSPTYGAGGMLLATTTDTWTGQSHHSAYIRCRTSWTGTNGNLDGGNRYCFGTWNVRSVSNGTSSWRLLCGSYYDVIGAPLSLSAGGGLLCIKLNALDAGAATEILGYTNTGAGRGEGLEGVLREPSGPTPRDLTTLVQMTRATTAETYPGDDPDHFVAVQRQNGWLDGLPADSTRSGHFWVPTRERIPLHGSTLTPPGKLAAEGGSFLHDDRYHAAGGLQGPRTYNALDWSFCQFSLSNDGAISTPTPPTLARVVLTPDREAVLSSLSALAIVPHAINPLSRTTADGEEVLTAGQYRIRWGGARKSRRVVELQWPGLSDVDIDQVHAQVASGAAVKFTADPDTVERAWHFDVDTWREGNSSDGLRSASVVAYELTWLTP